MDECAWNDRLYVLMVSINFIYHLICLMIMFNGLVALQCRIIIGIARMTETIKALGIMSFRNSKFRQIKDILLLDLLFLLIGRAALSE
jgi:hypothetical protein